MEYAIAILSEALNRLEDAFTNFVIKGTVPRTHIVALDNREKANQLKSAILAIREKMEEIKKKEEQDKVFKELSELSEEQLDENINKFFNSIKKK